MGKRKYAYVRKSGSKLDVYDKDGNISQIWKARFDMDISNEEIENFDQLKNLGELQKKKKVDLKLDTCKCEDASKNMLWRIIYKH